jgi:hypothetical protein
MTRILLALLALGIVSGILLRDGSRADDHGSGERKRCCSRTKDSHWTFLG